jgi:hypothetical protein
MKQFNLLFLLLLFGTISAAQNDYAIPDTAALHIRKDDYNTPAELAKALCKNLHTDTQKARAIFTWVAHNVKYYFKALDQDVPQHKTRAQANAYRERRNLNTYRYGRGICMDYANLYQHMTQAVGLECAFISGEAKSHRDGSLASHAWNAVKINGVWQLIDCTWAAGYGTESERFLKQFKPVFFFIEPRLLAVSHFPDDEKWQLLDAPLIKKEFKKQHNFNYGHPEVGIIAISNYAPLEIQDDGTTELRLKFVKPPYAVQINAGKNRPVECTLKTDGDWTVLRFKPGKANDIELTAVTKIMSRGKEQLSFTKLGTFLIQ